MQVQLNMHVFEMASHRDQRADSVQGRSAPYRIRYQGDEKAE